jgi:hypothetical protein
MENQKRPRGRPRKYTDRLILRSIRLIPSHWEKIEGAGAAAFRELMEKWNPQKTAGAASQDGQ